MVNKTIVIGAGVAGISSALKLLEKEDDFLIISDTLGGRMMYSKKEKVNFGALFVMANYHNAKKLVTKETLLKKTTACFHNNDEDYFSLLSIRTLRRSPELMRFVKIMEVFAQRYEIYKERCLIISQKDALEADPYMNELFYKPASQFIEENHIEKVAFDFVSKFSYACTGVSMDKISALDFLNVSMGMMVPIHRFKFDEDAMAQKFGEHYINDKIIKIESKNGIHTLTSELGNSYQAENIIVATPAAVTKELLGLDSIRETCKLYVFHVTAKLKPKFSKFEMNLFPFESEIIFTTVQDDGSYLIYTREKDADLYKVCESYELINMVSWDKAMYVYGRAYMEQQYGDSIFVAGDHNGLGLEPATISGIYAANQIIKKYK